MLFYFNVMFLSKMKMELFTTTPTAFWFDTSL